MIELNRKQSSAPLRSDVEGLKQLATNKRSQYRQRSQSLQGLRQHAASLVAPNTWLRQLPTRFVLHTVVALTVPMALLLSQLPARPQESAPTQFVTQHQVGPAIGPIELAQGPAALSTVGDPPLSDDAALPVPLSLSSRSELLAPLNVPATVSGDVVKLRNGPGLAYDEVTRVKGGDGIEVVGRHDEWLQVHRTGDGATYWVAAELVDIPDSVVLNLAQVPNESIPPPPPPKIGTVHEANVNLRDGPGTNYVTMAKMGLHQDLTLVERYQGWFLVEYGSVYGWVTQDLLTLAPGVVERIPVAQNVPDPNPPLVGQVLENAVNLRKGPGSAYERVSTVNADANLKLLAKYKDWFKVQLDNGTKAWIFSDLLKVSPMAARRVPSTNDIPALPVRTLPTRVTAPNGGGGGGASPAAANPGGASSNRVVNIPASGDVAGYAVQFVGSRYIWGGASPGGFDCSGLTSYVYRQFGVGLPHSAAGQYSSRYGAIIGSMNNLAPGDLMFYAGTGGHGGISHVSLYIGGGQMVHAMTPSYGVQISSIWGSYWQNHYVGAVRPYR